MQTLGLYRSRSLRAALLTCCALAFSLAVSAAPKPGEPPQRVRLTWWSTPSTSAAIGWEQAVGYAELRFDERAYWLENKRLRRSMSAQPSSQKDGTTWAHLTGLKPNTAYQVQIKTSDSESPLFWFVTAHEQPQDFTLIVGGDSRNHRKVRREANQLVAQLAPLAVLFGGDFTAQDTKKQWGRWLDDWQLSIGPDGRLTPLIPTRGNHDSEEALMRVWGRASPHFYFAFTLGGAQARLYTLNSERPAGGEQRAWLEADLKANANVQLKLAQYHKPMRPHSAMKMEGFDEYDNWGPLFSEHQLDLAIECDSHLMKVTWPVVHDPYAEAGFKRVSSGGTVFIGEGGWGAPLRSVSDPKPWTMKSGRINHVFLLKVKADSSYELKVLEVGAPLFKGQAAEPSSWRGFSLRRQANVRGTPESSPVQP